MRVANPPSLIYHYCDARAAASIIADRTLWLSSFSLTNDYREGLTGREAVMAVAAADAAYPGAMEAVEKKLRTIDEMFGSFGMCFSQHHDRLSQWRGYADDGAGFAIGFATAYTDWLTVPSISGQTPEVIDGALKLHQVLYAAEEHHEVGRAIYNTMAPHVPDLLPLPGDSDGSSRIFTDKRRRANLAVNSTLYQFWPELYSLKSDAFEEEDEWRVLAVAQNFQPGFGFRPARGKIVPYIAHKLPEDPVLNPIRDIVIGPRNTTPPYVVEMMLERCNMGSLVSIRNSTASYRY